MNSNNGNGLLTAREVAEKLRVHLYTVYHLIHTGQLKAFSVSRRWRIYKTSLDEFMVENSNTEQASTDDEQQLRFTFLD